MRRFLLVFFAFSFGAFAQFTVVSAASYQPVVSPNSLASLFGNGLATSTASATLDPSGQLPTQLASVSVTINGTAAGLLYVSPTQINFLVPATTDIGTASVMVQSLSQFTGSVQVRNVAPALFSLDASGKGPGAILNAVTFSTSPFLVETQQNPGSDKRTRLAVFATGLRYAGNPSHDPTIPNAAIQVQAEDHLGNIYAVEFAGAAPGFFGLDQVNLVVPAQADGAGDLTLSIAAENQVSNAVTFHMNLLPASSVHLASLSLAPSVVGGNDVSGTVALNATARSGGFAVNLTADSLLVQPPRTVTVPAGTSTAIFASHTIVTPTTNSATVSATAGGQKQSATVTVFPANSFALTGMSLSASSIRGGASLTGTVNLSGAPPLGGATVLLASDNAAVIVPSTVNLTFGQTSATFPITTAAVSGPQLANITATYSRSTASAKLSVQPLLTVTLPLFVTGGGTANGTIALFDKAPASGAVIDLSSSDPAIASVPASINIPSGQSTGAFTVTTTNVTAPEVVAVMASFGGVEKTVLLAVSPVGFPALASLSLSAVVVKGGADATGTVTLATPAPTGGVAVDLSSDAPFAAQVPPFVTIAAGQTTAKFTIGTTSVSSPQTVTIGANAGGVSKSATLTVQ